jgi:hypothetical protein
MSAVEGLLPAQHDLVEHDKGKGGQAANKRQQAKRKEKENGN